MKTIAIASLCVALFTILAVPSPARAENQNQAADEVPDKANEKAEEQALSAADTWLKLVDDEKYAESWDTAAEYLRGAIGKEAFVKALDGARKPLGAVTERKVKSKEYRTSLPGAPDGQYVVIQYETSFANKKSGTETVTPMLDKDGKWRVSGYFIK